MKCEECKIGYPSNLVNSVRISSYPTKFLCGICALDYINIIHGSDRKEFTAQAAEHLRQLAIKYRKDHPECLNSQQ